jgi:hypothetical protein
MSSQIKVAEIYITNDYLLEEDLTISESYGRELPLHENISLYDDFILILHLLEEFGVSEIFSRWTFQENIGIEETFPTAFRRTQAEELEVLETFLRPSPLVLTETLLLEEEAKKGFNYEENLEFLKKCKEICSAKKFNPHRANRLWN